MPTIEFIKPISPETMIPALAIGIKEGEVETEMVTLQLSKIDQAWRKDRFSYSGLGGMDRKESKIRGVKNWISTYSKVHAPIIYITNNDPKNLFFVDGRHTTAFLTESGYKEAKFIIPSIQLNIILNSFA
ncbi:hypothetical protein IBG34_10270 [Aeromonas media]|uniref:ParB/Sulfiredoxin domain-containing protein n=1 Tax=Aeromonas media TaxID=651 RepID=A0A6M4YJC7_AERME|nr:hypothetical protein [Aeromonas media]QJT22616.1 hypothetical protein E4184_15155 [Aeromonas media]QYK83005.1 hypothetical protein IBG34_10270 [Aeromonas media]